MSEQNYNEAMEQIALFLAKGSAKMTEADLSELQRLSLAVETYENLLYPMPITQNIQSFSK